jgi:hypothetical protein
VTKLLCGVLFCHFRKATTSGGALNAGKLLHHWRTGVGALFLLVQLILVVWARFHPFGGPFSWAPNDTFIDYQIRVSFPSHELTDSEILSRYDFRASGSIEDWPALVQGIIENRERALKEQQPHEVTFTYHLNGGETQQIWKWRNQ